MNSATSPTRSFEQIADAAASFQEFGDVGLLDVLRQHQDRKRGVLLPQDVRRP